MRIRWYYFLILWFGLGTNDAGEIDDDGCVLVESCGVSPPANADDGADHRAVLHCFYDVMCAYHERSVEYDHYGNGFSCAS
mmetsp:Transcript_41294/g.58097  ORF Transcript_41294/g.58097 Transcript_41294/m.58097 type:complete len:81 (-) Transcript_41294:1984-2226(-)